ncbi:MAG: 4-alpha-glucanotransferase [Alphaproteobacteria bacterium]|nr:4-alpha-glucanotransferase [Alphaproteobacteria bacterium]
MTDRDTLVRLARLVGIEVCCTDALGSRREASNETLLALIASFGLPSQPVLAAAEIEERARAAPFGRVHIVHAEDPNPGIPVRLPPAVREITWICRCEDGAEHEGWVAADAQAANAPVLLPLPAKLPIGYHRLAVEGRGAAAELDLIVAPASCYLPPQLAEGGSAWGLTCQLYGLRSGHDWGIGDFTDLAQIATAAGVCGAAVLGINPLHALFAAEPLHYSPYAPSSRLWLDFLYVDATAAPGFAEDEAVQRLAQSQWFGATHWAARSAPLVDYSAVSVLKRRVLEALYCRFRLHDLGENGGAQTDLGWSFRRFQQANGQSLVDFAVFEALHEHYCDTKVGFSWRNWPAPLRYSRSPEVTAFTATHRERVEFFQFLQWEADRQLASAAAAGREAGLALGLYRDLAVGADPNGAEAWADQQLMVPQASIGAPPDVLNRAGQNWGLAPINPMALRDQGFAPFIACVRANMRHAAVLRMDHVMSLTRLYWIPNGMNAMQGAYVNYPLNDLLRIVALESRRHQCAVVGEDLGTVPAGFRETMRAANVLSYRIMGFERRSDGSYVPPEEYPPLAAASAATHDLATLEGFWLGCDIAWRRRLNLYPDAEAASAEAAERVGDRQLLLGALITEGLLADTDRAQFLTESGEPVYRPALGDAIQRYLARSRARLMLVQIEDLAGETEQANLPGTIDAHPNWRRRLGRSIEEIINGGELRRLATLIEAERPRAATP